MFKLTTVLFFLAFVASVYGAWPKHEYSSEVSGQIANAIKQKLYTPQLD